MSPRIKTMGIKVDVHVHQLDKMLDEDGSVLFTQFKAALKEAAGILPAEHLETTRIYLCDGYIFLRYEREETPEEIRAREQKEDKWRKESEAADWAAYRMLQRKLGLGPAP